MEHVAWLYLFMQCVLVTMQKSEQNWDHIKCNDVATYRVTILCRHLLITVMGKSGENDYNLGA